MIYQCLTIYDWFPQVVKSHNTNFKGPSEKPALAESCIEECRKIVIDGIKKLEKEKPDKGAVLIFLPGELEISKVSKCFYYLKIC